MKTEIPMKTYCYEVCFAPSGYLNCIRKLEVEKLITPNSFNRYLATEKIDEDSFNIVCEVEQSWDGFPFDKDEKYDCYVERNGYFTNLEAAKKFAEDILTRNIRELIDRAEELKRNLIYYEIQG
jgi:hypothetical protein